MEPVPRIKRRSGKLAPGIVLKIIRRYSGQGGRQFPYELHRSLLRPSHQLIDIMYRIGGNKFSQVIEIFNLGFVAGPFLPNGFRCHEARLQKDEAIINHALEHFGRQTRPTQAAGFKAGENGLRAIPAISRVHSEQAIPRRL